MTGKVDADQVTLSRVIPFVDNPFKPYFFGCFERNAHETTLRGTFHATWPARVFLAFWLCLCIVCGALAAISVPPGDLWVVLLLGIELILMGVSSVFLGVWSARHDEAAIRKVISEALLGAA